MSFAIVNKMPVQHVSLCPAYSKMRGNVPFGMFQAGMTHPLIANHFNCSRMTIYRLLVRVRATGTTPGVIVWGGISHVGKTNLKLVVGNLNDIRYRDEILAPIVLPFI